MPPHNDSSWVGLAMPRPAGPTYRPDVFDVATEHQARQIILTPERGTTTDERWQKETPFLVEDISKHLSLTTSTCLLDYGCGIGRLAKPLIEKHGCRVVGADVSPSMRLLAPGYVLSDRFLIWSPEVLDQMIAKGFRADAAICCWVIQHVPEPAKTIAQIAATLKDGALLYSLNQIMRAVPTDRGWIDDRFDMRTALRQSFKEEQSHTLPPTATTPQLSAGSMIQILRKR